MPTKTAYKTILKIKNYKKKKCAFKKRERERKEQKKSDRNKPTETETCENYTIKNRDLLINKIVKNGIHFVCI